MSNEYKKQEANNGDNADNDASENEIMESVDRAIGNKIW